MMVNTEEVTLDEINRLHFMIKKKKYKDPVMRYKNLDKTVFD